MRLDVQMYQMHKDAPSPSPRKLSVSGLVCVNQLTELEEGGAGWDAGVCV
jgi:hypothetical protein